MDANNRESPDTPSLIPPPIPLLPRMLRRFLSGLWLYFIWGMGIALTKWIACHASPIPVSGYICAAVCCWAMAPLVVSLREQGKSGLANTLAALAVLFPLTIMGFHMLSEDFDYHLP